MDGTYFMGFVLLVLGLGAVHCCDESAIVSCTTTLGNVVQGKNIYESEQVFNNFCTNEMATYKSCLSGKTTGCETTVKKLFQGIFNAYTYMCGDGQSETVQYGACSDSATNKAALSVCQNTMTSKIQTGPSNICGYLDEYLSCSRDATTTNCGSGSGPWYDKVISLTTGPLLEEAGCETDIGNDGNGGNGGNGGNDGNGGNGCSGLTATITLLAGAFLLQWLSR